MKKALVLISVILVVFSFSSCSRTTYKDSLEEYIQLLNMQGNVDKNGNSDTEIDGADYFLPSRTFISDFEYVEGGYHYYEELSLDPNYAPEVCILYLRYEPTVYSEAKDFTLENIPAYDDEVYTYNDYVFYLNANFFNLKKQSYSPRWFTMSCYNDSNNTLIFLGFCKPSGNFIDVSNWTEFVDTYYGEYYDFSK